MNSLSTKLRVARRLQMSSRSRVARITMWMLLGLLAFAVVWVHAQNTTPRTPTARKVNRPSLPHLYVAFLLYQNHLDQAAAVREQQGKDGSWLRDHFQRELGFAPSQFQLVRESGLRLQSELKEIGSEAETIGQHDRAARLENPGTSQIPNPQLGDLTKERENLIQREIDNLNQNLGPKDAAKLQDFLTKQFLQGPTSAHPHARPHVPAHWPPPSEGMPRP